MIQFVDGSMKAQLGLPDMRLPIQYALGYPERLSNNFPRFDYKDFSSLTFQSPDIKKFRNLALAFSALEKGGNLPCVLNAANEIVVEAFLNNKIGFLEMPKVIEKTMNTISFIGNPSIEDYCETDAEARKIANQFILG